MPKRVVERADALTKPAPVKAAGFAADPRCSAAQGAT
jgi:hypothetical protein